VITAAEFGALIDEASAYLAGKIRETPIEYSYISPGRTARLKLESFQDTGSFKLRGALFRCSRLTEKEKKDGVVTCSAGNHGKAMAWTGANVTICVPRSVDQAKLSAMQSSWFADVLVSDFDGYDETEVWARELAAERGKTFISPFDDYAVMAGNGGSLAVETLRQFPQARNFVLPVGGGGLAAGFAFEVKRRKPDAKIICCQHVLSPALRMSLDAGRAITKLPAVETIAGGVEGGIGALTFEILAPLVDHVALVTEEQILSAMRWMIGNHQYLIEPTAAVTIAACQQEEVREFLRRLTVIVVSGRNVSLDSVKRILCGS
jgi:threonine dehydratase